MEVLIKYWFQESDDDTKRLASTTLDLDGISEDNKFDIASDYLCNMLMTPDEDGSISVLDFGINQVLLGPAELGEIPQEQDLPVLEKNVIDISLLSERMYIDLPANTRFWGRHRSGNWMLSVKREDGSSIVLQLNEVYNPSPDKLVLVPDNKTFSLIQKQSPEKATKMATKKATPKKAAKKTATKKTSEKKTSEKKAPTKKSLVEGFLKKGMTPAEIVEAMAKNGTPSTIASVRAFIATINNGG